VHPGGQIRGNERRNPRLVHREVGGGEALAPLAGAASAEEGARVLPDPLRPARSDLALVYGAVRGITLGTWAVAIDATWPAYYGRGRLGSIRGMTFAAEIVGAALGPIPFGVVHDVLGGYDIAILGLLVLPVAATAAVLLARPPGLTEV
jgi:hypothetical protein